MPAAWSFEEACGVDLVLLTLDQQLLTQLGPKGGEGAFLYLQVQSRAWVDRGLAQGSVGLCSQRVYQGLWPGLRACRGPWRLA